MNLYLGLCAFLTLVHVEIFDRHRIQASAYADATGLQAWIVALSYFLAYSAIAPMLFFKDCIMLYFMIRDRIAGDRNEQ